MFPCEHRQQINQTEERAVGALVYSWSLRTKGEDSVYKLRRVAVEDPALRHLDLRLQPPGL
jgi:hypothetical protein